MQPQRKQLVDAEQGGLPFCVELLIDGLPGGLPLGYLWSQKIQKATAVGGGMLHITALVGEGACGQGYL